MYWGGCRWRKNPSQYSTLGKGAQPGSVNVLSTTTVSAQFRQSFTPSLPQPLELPARRADDVRLEVVVRLHDSADVRLPLVERRHPPPEAFDMIPHVAALTAPRQSPIATPQNEQGASSSALSRGESRWWRSSVTPGNAITLVVITHLLFRAASTSAAGTAPDAGC